VLHVLHADALTRALGEGNHVRLELLALLEVHPALGHEIVAVRKDAFIVMHEDACHADGSLASTVMVRRLYDMGRNRLVGQLR
jgi:hypothetical protein